MNILTSLVPISHVVSEKKIKMQKFTNGDDVHQVMTISHMTLWVKLAKIE